MLHSRLRAIKKYEIILISLLTDWSKMEKTMESENLEGNQASCETDHLFDHQIPTMLQLMLASTTSKLTLLFTRSNGREVTLSFCLPLQLLSLIKWCCMCDAWGREHYSFVISEPLTLIAQVCFRLSSIIWQCTSHKSKFGHILERPSLKIFTVQKVWLKLGYLLLWTPELKCYSLKTTQN